MIQSASIKIEIIRKIKTVIFSCHFYSHLQMIKIHSKRKNSHYRYHKHIKCTPKRFMPSCPFFLLQTTHFFFLNIHWVCFYAMFKKEFKIENISMAYAVDFHLQFFSPCFQVIEGLFVQHSYFTMHTIFPAFIICAA